MRGRRGFAVLSVSEAGFNLDDVGGRTFYVASTIRAVTSCPWNLPTSSSRISAAISAGAIARRETAARAADAMGRMRVVTDIAERQQYFGYRVTVRDLCRLTR